MRGDCLKWKRESIRESPEQVVLHVERLREWWSVSSVFLCVLCLVFLSIGLVTCPQSMYLFTHIRDVYSLCRVVDVQIVVYVSCSI